MARVQPYERAVDAIFHTISTFNTEIQNGTKIKEEPIDTTSSINATEECILDINCYSLIDHDYDYRDNLLSSNSANINNIDVNNTKNVNRDSLNNSLTFLNNVNKTVNLDHKNAKQKEKICNALLQHKKLKYGDSNNKNTNTLNSTTEKTTKKRKHDILSNYKIKIRRTNNSSTCDVCFRQFSSVRSCESHKQYYDLIDNICRLCRKFFVTHKKLQAHIRRKHGHRESVHLYKCNFCNRSFKRKTLLQSHLFHTHSELIYDFNKTIEYEKNETLKSKNINMSFESDSLISNENKSGSNVLKEDNSELKETNTTFVDKANKSSDDSMINSKKLCDDMPPTKRLRQPTLTEYLDLHKKKYDIKFSRNKLDNTLHHDEQEKNLRSKFPEERHKIDSLSTKSDNLSKQTTHSIPHQSAIKDETCTVKKPFVRLHADVEIMKSFLEKLPYTIIKNKITSNRTSDSDSHDREIPYSLRSLSGVSSMEAIQLNSGIKEKKNISKKSQDNTELTIVREQRTDADKVDPKVDWKIIMTQFKCKECTIPLTRCDERSKSPQTFTSETVRNAPPNIEYNSTFSQKNDIRNKIILKKVEVSVERLTTIPTIDYTTLKIESDPEKQNNNYFVCKVCKKDFPSKLARHVHIKLSHIAYMSSICEARYTTKHKLLQHYLCEHIAKQNQCCICYVLLPDYEVLKQHLSVHCLKYNQREDDKYPIDIELKCNMRMFYKCLYCAKTFSSQLFLETHQSYCIKQDEKNQKLSVEESNGSTKDISEVQHNMKTNENIVTYNDQIDSFHNLCEDIIIYDEKTDPENSCESLNIVTCDRVEEKTNEQMSLCNDKELERITNHNRIETIESENFIVKTLEKNNFTFSNQNMQLDNVIKTMTYPCDTCGKQFQNPKKLEVHIRNFSLTTDICPICGTGFSSIRLLRSHITAAHVPQISKTYSFHCVFCNQGFFKKHDLRPHILHLHSQHVLNALTRNFNASEEKSDTSSNIHTVMCNICNLVFESHDRYIEHRMYYYKNHTFSCSLCAQNFEGMYMFHHHNKLLHYSEEKRKSYTYICDICKEGFNLESHFYSHNMHVHSKEINLIETAKEFEEKTNSNSPQNIQNIINLSAIQAQQDKQSSNNHTCEICQLKCKDMNQLVKHKEFYSNNGDFKCDQCKRQCKTFYLLEQHRKLTHNKFYNGYICYICGEVLETITSIKCHEKHFHLNSRNNIEENGQTLSSNVAYKMTESSYKFKNNTCNVSEYSCLFCDMKFSTANTVQTHIVHVHMDDMIAKRSILKLSLPTINDNKRIEIGLSSLSTSSSSALKDTSVKPLQNSVDQQSNFVHKVIDNTKNKTNNTTVTCKTINKTTTELKELKTTPLNDDVITQKTQIPVMTYFNKSKTTSANTKSKTNTLVSPPTALTTFTTLTTNVNTPVLVFGPTISKAIAPNIRFTNNTSVSQSTGNICNYGISSKSVNELKTNLLPILPPNKTTTINKPTFSLSSGSSSTFKVGSRFRLIIPQNQKTNQIINQISESLNNNSYSCPLCPLEYPSLIFFHAHLKYAHADSIRTDDQINSQIYPSTEVRNTSMIECLLCPCSFVDEAKYKRHLRNSHTYYVYIPNSEQTNKTNNPSVLCKDKTNINSKNTIETIIVDDDNTKNTLNQQVETTTLDNKNQNNEKVGKLRVKSFAKIIETLSTNSAFQ